MHKTILICNLLKTKPLTCKEVGAAMNMSESIASSMISHLCKYGCVSPTGEKRGRHKVYQFEHMPNPSRKHDGVPRHHTDKPMRIPPKTKPSPNKTPPHYAPSVFLGELGKSPTPFGARQTAEDVAALRMLARPQ